MVTINEAAKCPKCGQMGDLNATKSLASLGIPDFQVGDDVAVYICTNEHCTWYNTGWLVQTDARGNVYERPQGTRGQDKTFEQLSPDQLARGRRTVEQIQEDEQVGNDGTTNNTHNK